MVHHKKKKMKKLVSIPILLIISFWAASSVSAQNASLYLAPSAGAYTVGNTFLVQVKVNSGGVPINAADGTLIFDTDKLDVVSLSKTDSVFSLWVQEPSYSNSLGTINFTGGKPTPGFTGAAGTILNITFKAKTAGTTNLTFATGSVLRDDGKGTNILTSMGAGAYTLSSRVVVPIAPESPEATIPSAVAVTPAQTDTESPEPFEVRVDNEGDQTNPTPMFLFETTDKISGIHRYEITLNEKLYATIKPDDIKDKPYRPSALPPGVYSLEVKAFDKEDNFALASTDFEISPSGFVNITKIPKNVNIGDILRIEGETLPETNVRVYIQREGAEPILEKVRSGSSGNFVLQYDKALPQGDYLVWAQMEDERGSLSELTSRYFFKVGLPPFLQFGKIALDYLTTMITLIILIFGAIAVIFYTLYRISIWRKRMAKETKEVSQSVNGAFRALKEEVEEQISMLDKKPGLTKEEKAIRDKLQEALDISEKFITKEIRDIEKELE